jgi:4'-phosphopantetheinyl transferase
MSGLDALEPRPWRLEQAPPGPGILGSPAESAERPHPLLLLIDRRRPLPSSLQAELAASLSPAERSRLDALRRPDDRERFLLGRAALRRLIGGWLGRAPAAVPIECGPHGKPRCPGGPEFNLSHSGDLILLALHPRRPVGVDVERERPGLDWRPIARRVLPAVECRVLKEQAEATGERRAAQGFLAAWCRLEAQLKAGGKGLVGLEEARGNSDVAAPLTVWDVRVPAGYRAAAALARPISGSR